MKNTILTIMCMVYKDDGSFLVQNRLKNDWPGINFPGGHVEDNESIEEACIREIKEETGLIISNLENVGYFEWNIEKDRHLCILFRTKSFKGTLMSSKEGEIFFIKKDELNKFKLSVDFDEILKITSKGLLENK